MNNAYTSPNCNCPENINKNPNKNAIKIGPERSGFIIML